MRWMGSKRRCRSTGPPRPERVRAAQGCFAAGERIRLYKLMRDLSLNDMVLAGGEGRELLAAAASAWLGRRTTGATLGSQPADCARTRTCSGPPRPATL